MDHGVGGVLEMNRLAVEEDLSRRRLLDAGNDLDQVDLPAPFSPTSTFTAPARISKSACFTATVPE